MKVNIEEKFYFKKYLIQEQFEINQFKFNLKIRKRI